MLTKRAVRDLKEPAPQVSMLLHREVLEKFDGPVLDALRQSIGSFVFVEFFKSQLQAVEKDIIELDPNQENYIQLSRDMRLIWRFWTDLLNFAEECKPQ